jgi:hypothetical protein
MSSEGCEPVMPIQSVTQQLQIKMALILNVNLLGRMWDPAADYNGCLAHFKFLKRATNDHYYLHYIMQLFLED